MGEQLLVGLGLTLVLTPALIFVSVLLKLYEHPNERRINSTPVPTAGGLGLYVAFLLLLFGTGTPICQLILQVPPSRS